jgi:hypothetical protein
MATPPVRRAPAPFVSPASGDLDQRLAQVVGYINSIRSTMNAPTFSQLTLVDELGQSWLVSVDSSGALHTSLVPR